MFHFFFFINTYLQLQHVAIKVEQFHNQICLAFSAVDHSSVKWGREETGLFGHVKNGLWEAAVLLSDVHFPSSRPKSLAQQKQSLASLR